MKEITTTVFSGNMPRGCGLKNQMAADLRSKGMHLLVFDFHRMGDTGLAGAVALRLGDLIPYLSAESCADLISGFVYGEDDHFRFLVSRFVRSFQVYSRFTGINLFDVQAWNMTDLLNGAAQVHPELQRLLENNFDSLARLENFIWHLSSLIQPTGADLETAVRYFRPLYFRFACGMSQTDLQQTVTQTLRAVCAVFDRTETVLLTDGLPPGMSQAFYDVILSSGYKTNAFFEDLFLLPEAVRSAFLAQASKAVFFKHHNDHSIRGISEFLGSVESNDVTVTRYPDRRRILQMPPYAVFGDMSAVTRPSHRDMGFSVAKKAKPKLREDEIDAIPEDEAIVVDLRDRSFVITSVG